MQKPASKPKEELLAIRNYFHAAAGSERLCSLDIRVDSGDAVKASSTFTISSGATSDTAVLSGVTFTCVDHRELTTMQSVDDSGGNLNSTYFTMQDQSGAHKYYVWYNINSAGVDPAVAGRIGIEIKGATGVLDETLSAALTTATALTDGSAKITLPTDSSESLDGTYFTISDGDKNKAYIWFSIGGAGENPDPAPVGYAQGIMVSGVSGATGTVLATAAFTACLGVLKGFTASNPSAGVFQVFANNGNTVVMRNGPSVATSTQGTIVQSLQGILITTATDTNLIRNVVPGTGTATADSSGAATSFVFTRTITGSALTSIQYNLGPTDTDTATSLAAQINAKSTLFQVATATSAAGVVTATSFYPGPVGNYITTTSTSNVTSAHTTLLGGAIATTVSAVNTYHSGV